MRSSLETLRGKKNLMGCEIGVDKGDNARIILKNLDLQRLYLVEPFDSLSGIFNETPSSWEEQTVKRVKEFQGKTEITWLIKKSEDVTDEEIPPDTLHFVYIDGCHEYPTVSVDLKQYWPRVKSGGLFAGHDYYVGEKRVGKITTGHGQVKKAVDEFFANMGFTGYYLNEPVPEGNFMKHKIFQVRETDWWVYK